MQGGAVGTLADGGAATARLEVVLSVDAFPSGVLSVLDGAGDPVFGTDPGGGLVSLSRAGGAYLTVGTASSIASEEAVVAAKVATARRIVRAKREGVGGVVASRGSRGNLVISTCSVQGLVSDRKHVDGTHVASQSSDDPPEKRSEESENDRVLTLDERDLSRQTSQGLRSQDTGFGTETNTLQRGAGSVSVPASKQTSPIREQNSLEQPR